MNRLEKCKILIERGYVYNPYTGIVTGKYGKEITKKCKYYTTICFLVDNKQYSLKVHQYAWYIVYGEIVDRLDHIEIVTPTYCNNKINNLRKATRQQNGFNQIRKGYSKKGNKYITRISTYNGRITIGSYYTEEEAHEAYLEAKKIYHII